MAFQKTTDGGGETEGSEVFFLKSPNLLQEKDPKNANWQTLPTGLNGLKGPLIGEEPHILQVGDNPLRVFSLWRSMEGWLSCSYSSDGGYTWDEPFWMTY